MMSDYLRRLAAVRAKLLQIDWDLEIQQIINPDQHVFRITVPAVGGIRGYLRMDTEDGRGVPLERLEAFVDMVMFCIAQEVESCGGPLCGGCGLCQLETNEVFRRRHDADFHDWYMDRVRGVTSVEEIVPIHVGGIVE